MVLQLATKGFKILEDTTEQLLVRGGSRHRKPNQLVSKSTYLNATGLEGFIGVPGRVGGAIYNNAHYLQHLIGDYIEKVVSFHVKNNQEMIFSHENCNFAYEHSIFQEDKQLVILSVTFLLKKDQPVSIRKKLVEAQTRRVFTSTAEFT